MIDTAIVAVLLTFILALLGFRNPEAWKWN